MKKFLFLLASASLLLVSSQSCVGRKNYGLNDHLKTKYVYGKDEVLLKEGQNRFLPDKELNFTFTRVLEDSRCVGPQNCPNPGTAVVEVTLITTTSRPQTLRISLDSRENKPADVAHFADFEIRLKKLDPTGEPGVTKYYRALFSVINTTK